MEPITNRVGHTLLEFVHLASEEAINPKTHLPIVASLVVGEYEDKLLLVFNRKRQQWELPSGRIEMGESQRECAIRELMEESGQSVNDLDFIGIAKVHREESEIIFLAVYSCILPTIPSFQPNDEIEKTEYWDFHTDIGYINETDRYIINLVMKR